MSGATILKLVLVLGVGFGVWKLIERASGPGYAAPPDPGIPPGAPNAKAGEQPAPNSPNLPDVPRPSDLPPAEGTMQQLTTDPIQLKTGATYYVNLNVGGFLASLANPAQIAETAATQGFADVIATADKPAGWPSKLGASFYVKGRYVQPSKAQSKSFFPGVTIVDIYQG